MLAIKKFGYSRSPWRFELNGHEFPWIGDQPRFAFPRKCDAKPFFERLLAICDWSRYLEFTDEQKQAVVELSKETECHKSFVALMARDDEIRRVTNGIIH